MLIGFYVALEVISVQIGFNFQALDSRSIIARAKSPQAER
jgi:hypothetical protein